MFYRTRLNKLLTLSNSGHDLLLWHAPAYRCQGVTNSPPVLIIGLRDGFLGFPRWIITVIPIPLLIDAEYITLGYDVFLATSDIGVSENDNDVAEGLFFHGENNDHDDKPLGFGGRFFHLAAGLQDL